MSCLRPKLATRVENVAKAGEDFVPIALFFIEYAIIGGKRLNGLSLVELLKKLEEIKGFEEWQEENLEKGDKHIIVSMKHIEEGPKKPSVVRSFEKSIMMQSLHILHRFGILRISICNLG